MGPRTLNFLLWLIIGMVIPSAFLFAQSKALKTQLKPTWQNEFSLSQWAPTNAEINYGSSEIENLFIKHWNSNYGTSAYVRAGKYWLRPQDIEAGAPETFIEDPYISLVRKWRFPLRAAIYLPASEDSKDAQRRFAFSLQPTFHFKTSRTEFTLNTEFLYFNNQAAESLRDETRYNNVHGISQRAGFVYFLSRSWSWSSKAAAHVRWDYEGSPKEFYELYTGPAYDWSRLANISLNYYSSDQIFTENTFMSSDVSWVGLMLKLFI